MSVNQMLSERYQQALEYHNAGFQWPPQPFQQVSYLRKTPCVVLAQIGPKWYVVSSGVAADVQYPIECQLGDLTPVESKEPGWVPYRFWATFMAERRPPNQQYDMKHGAVPDARGNIWCNIEVEAGRSRRNPFRFAINGVIPVGAPNGDFCLRPAMKL